VVTGLMTQPLAAIRNNGRVMSAFRFALAYGGPLWRDGSLCA